MDLKHNYHNLVTTNENALKQVFLSSDGFSLVTFITFAFAMTAVPIPGTNTTKSK